MTAAVLVGAAIVLGVRLPRTSHRKLPTTAIADLAALVGLAVDGGMGLHESLRWAADQADPSLRPELRMVLRRASHFGLARALREVDGPAAPLLRALARPFDTGAAIAPVVSGLRERLEAEHLADVLSRLERLPVKLALPLALLMLPGLLLMIVAPALIDALSRFG